MISNSEITRILNNGKQKYDKEQVIAIRNLLQTIANLDYELNKKGGQDDR